MRKLTGQALGLALSFTLLASCQEQKSEQKAGGASSKGGKSADVLDKDDKPHGPRPQDRAKGKGKGKEAAKKEELAQDQAGDTGDQDSKTEGEPGSGDEPGAPPMSEDIPSAGDEPKGEEMPVEEATDTGTGTDTETLPPPPPPPPPPPAPKEPTAEEKFQAMIKAGKMMTTVMVDKANVDLDANASANNWFSSAAKPIKVYVAVGTDGSLATAQGVNAKQIAAGTVAAPADTKFQANNADVTALHSSLRVCNNSGQQIYLHSGNGGPFAHGSGAITNGACAQLLVERTTANAGATYDHLAGNGFPVSFQIIKIGPDGKVVP